MRNCLWIEGGRGSNGGCGRGVGLVLHGGRSDHVGHLMLLLLLLLDIGRGQGVSGCGHHRVSVGGRWRLLDVQHHLRIHYCGGNFLRKKYNSFTHASMGTSSSLAPYTV